MTLPIGHGTVDGLGGIGASLALLPEAQDQQTNLDDQQGQGQVVQVIGPARDANGVGAGGRLLDIVAELLGAQEGQHQQDEKDEVDNQEPRVSHFGVWGSG